MKWLRRLFGHSAPVLPPESQALHEEAETVIRVLREGNVRITVVPKNRRALDELRRLQDHARR